jgi:chorismate dehydratase
MNLDELLQKNEISPHNLTNNKSFCFTTSYLTAPLVSGFLSNEVKHNYKIYNSETSLCSEMLKTDQTDFGLISAIDYEAGRGNWLIVPQIGLSCKQGSNWATLFMKEGTKTLKKIAVDRHAGNEIALLKIIMQEKYEIEAEFILSEPLIDDMLKENDAALLIGENALVNLSKYPTHIDLCEEWYDMSGLPFVISFWAGHELSLNAADVARINQAKMHGEFSLDKIIKQYAVDHNIEKHISANHYKEIFSFDLNEDEKAGLEEFYQYAFYLGIFDNIPELHFFD